MSNVKVDKEKNEERFEFISEQQYWGTIYSVFVDKVTGVTYLSSMREGTRVTPLLDKLKKIEEEMQERLQNCQKR